MSQGGSVTEAIGRIRNAGGGVIRVPAEKVAEALATTPRGVLQASDGSVVVLDTRFGGKKDAVTIINTDGSTKKVTGAQVLVNNQGDVVGARFGGSNYVVARTNVDITKNQRDGLISINLPPNLRGASYDKAGNLNGWKINPKAIKDPAVRAAVYRLMDKSGVIKVPKDSPIYAKLEARLSKAGYERTKVGEIDRLFQETENFRYRAGDAERSRQLAAAFGAGQRKANEAQG